MKSESYNNINALLTKFLKEELPGEGKQQLFDLISSPCNEESFKEILFSLLNVSAEDNQVTDAVDFDNVYANILAEIRHQEIINNEIHILKSKGRTRKILLTGLSMAAVFTIAFFLGSFFTKSKNISTAEPVIIVSSTEIKAPYGSKSEIKLPDGTQVILNAGSTLKYKSDFNLTNRDLALAGEGYFKVAKNIDLPLNVNVGNISIKAVGTEFNVKAYDDEGVIETTLVNGKVEITQLGQNEGKNQFIDLIPNQKAIYIREEESFTLEKIKDNDPSLVGEPAKTIYDNILISPKVDVNQVAAWTRGKLVIRGENLGNLCIDLQRKYDVTFTFVDEEIKKFRFTGILLDETLEQVLNVIKLTAPIKYQVKGKTVFLSSDKEHLNEFSKYLK